MKHIALLTTLLLSASLQAVEKPYDYVFFENSLMKGDYFYSQAKYTSPSWIKNARHHLPVAGSVAFTPGNSLELTYVSAPVEIGIARYNIARSVAMTSFVSPLRSLYKYN